MALSIRFWNPWVSWVLSPITVGSGPWVTLAPLSRMLAARSLSTPWTSVGHVHRFDVQVLPADPGVVEQIADQVLHADGRRGHLLQVQRHLLTQLVDPQLLLHQLGVTGDGPQRLFQVVGGDEGEAFQLLVGSLQRCRALLGVRGALGHPLLQRGVQRAQVAVGVLDPLQHLVEGSHGDAHLVLGALLGAQAVVVALGDRPGGGGQLVDRPRDQALQAGRQGERAQRRSQHHQPQHHPEQLDPPAQRFQAAHQPQRALSLPPHLDGVVEDEAAADETRLLRLGVDGTGGHRPGADVAGEQLTADIEQAGRQDVGLRRQWRQHLLRAGGVGERQRRDAVPAQDVGDGPELQLHHAPVRIQVEQRQRSRDQPQRRAGRDHHDRQQLEPDGKRLKPAHVPASPTTTILDVENCGGMFGELRDASARQQIAQPGRDHLERDTQQHQAGDRGQRRHRPGEIRRVSGMDDRRVSQTTPAMSRHTAEVARARTGRLGPVAAITAATVAPPIDSGNTSGTATSWTQLASRRRPPARPLAGVAALVLGDHGDRRQQQHEAPGHAQRRQRQPQQRQQRPPGPGHQQDGRSIETAVRRAIRCWTSWGYGEARVANAAMALGGLNSVSSDIPSSTISRSRVGTTVPGAVLVQLRQRCPARAASSARPGSRGSPAPAPGP